MGIIWQLCLTALPVYLVLRNWPWVGAILAVLAVTTVFIKFNWYDKLEKPGKATQVPESSPAELYTAP